MIVNTSAIVLKSFSYGESSLIARCFSEKNGKVSLIVKGAKKNKSPKAPYFQPLCYIDIIYNHKLNRDLQILSKVNFRQYWFKIYGPFSTLKGTLIWYQREIGPGDGLTSIFSNQNYAGMWLALVWPFCIGLLIRHKNIFQFFLNLIILTFKDLNI